MKPLANPGYTAELGSRRPHHGSFSLHAVVVSDGFPPKKSRILSTGTTGRGTVKSKLSLMWDGVNQTIEDLL